MRIITLLLTLVLVISVGFVSCTKDDSQKDANSSANDDKSSATVENSTDENCACSEDGVLDALSVDEIGSEEASGTDGSLDKPATDGIDLIYYEDFENRSLHKTNDTVFKALGWKEESLLTGAVSNNTTTYKIVDFADSRRLYLRNNKSGGGDSYVTVLSSAVMGKFHEENYTYQYDIVYEDASASSRYVALVSDYNGKFFNSFHLRNGGTANNQSYAYGEWHTYDSAPQAMEKIR